MVDDLRNTCRSKRGGGEEEGGGGRETEDKRTKRAAARGGGNGVVERLRMARASDAKAGAIDGSISNAASVVLLAESHVLLNPLNSCQPPLHSLRAQSATRVEQLLHDALTTSSALTSCSFTPPNRSCLLHGKRPLILWVGRGGGGGERKEVGGAEHRL